VPRPVPPAATTDDQRKPGRLAGAAAARPSGSATRASELVARLREDLVACVLRPGEPLRLGVMREKYGAGLTPLREALFQLVAEGLVTMEEQRGFRVAEVSLEDLADLTEQRVFLEGQALRLAIERGDLTWESRVLAAHHRLAGTPMLEPGTATLTDAWTDAHRDFHRVLVDACGSAWLLRFREVLSDQAERYRRLSVLEKPDRDVAQEHRRLTEAVLARDAERAVQYLAAHYRLTAQLCRIPHAH
jgi:GntR family carbon starvation induced transcriptional regulator